MEKDLDSLKLVKRLKTYLSQHPAHLMEMTKDFGFFSEMGIRHWIYKKSVPKKWKVVLDKYLENQGV